jgi:hypothetical protein
MSPVFERFVVPGNAQVELSAVDARTYPEWPTGAEAAVADASTVAIATRPGMEGSVRIIVGEDLGTAVTEGWSLVFEGALISTGGRYKVGSAISADLFDAPISANRMCVRVFVRPLIEPVNIAFETIPDREP